MNARILTSSLVAVALTIALSTSNATAGCHSGGGGSYHGGGHGSYSSQPCLPMLGFVSQTVYCAGERVLCVTPGSIACLMGLEPGDFILSINGYPLHYEYSWRRGLAQAVSCGGHIDLEVRKCNGQIVILHWDLYGAPPAAPAPVM